MAKSCAIMCPSIREPGSRIRRYRLVNGRALAALLLLAGALMVFVLQNPATVVSMRHCVGQTAGALWHAWVHRGWPVTQFDGWRIHLPPDAPIASDPWGNSDLQRPLLHQAQWVATAAERAYVTLAELTGVMPPAQERPALSLYSSQAEVGATWGDLSGHGAIGLYWAGTVGIVAPGTWLAGAGDLGAGGEAALTAILAHELTHWALDHASGGRIPRWLGEGLALRAEERVLGERALPELLAARAARAGPAPVVEFSTWFASPAATATEEGRAYVLSRSLVGWIDQVAPAGWEETLISALRQGLPFDRAFARATLTELGVLEAGWLAELDAVAKAQ
jgi:hypothetical protein